MLILSGCSATTWTVNQESSQPREENSTLQTTTASQNLAVASSTIIETATSQTSESEEITMNHLIITVGNQTFNGTITEGATGEAFKAMLPMTISMDELNGNEKYYYLPGSLPTNSQRVGTIRNGDLMLYGASCLVLFYKDFPTTYSYSRIASMEDTTGLAQAVGRRGVEVTFELVE
ncbi:hypothetical protein IGI42_000626 [Enterococcus sp. AZ109]